MSIVTTGSNGRVYYRDAIGQFTTREGQLGKIASAVANNDWEAYEAEVVALANSDAANGYREPFSAKAAVHPGLKNIENEIAERDRLIESGTAEELTAFITERINRPEFQDMLDERDAVRAKAKGLKEEYQFLENAAKKNPDFDYELVRAKGFELLDAHDELQVLKTQANEYKDVTAPAVARLAALEEERMRADGTWREYTAATLNGLVETGEFESGSREWLEQRKKGIGGSDVGKIIGVYGRRGEDSEENLIQGKLAPVTDEEVAEQAAGHTDFAGYAGRGNAWEPHIFNQYAANHPEQNVTFCKTSWKSSAIDYQFANFDGLMTDKNGRPNGILEIKTASDASKWGEIGKPEENLDRIPPGYKAQVLWYCQAAGFNKGAVAVMIDDREYREYPFKITPELRAEMNENLAQVNKFVTKVNARRRDPNAVSPIAAPRKGFGPKILNDARLSFTGKTETNREQYAKTAFGEAAVWREESVAQTRARFEALCTDVKDPEAVATALRTLYVEKDPQTRRKPFINLDLETSGSSPTAGHIIEVGISIRNPQGGERAQHNSLYGLPKRMERIGAVGAVDVHQINIGKISNKKQFRNPEVQREVLAKLKGGILVAHNANFERRWLRLHLDGFAEAERRGEIQIIDTMTLTERFLPQAASNRLESMCGAFGIEYKNAHRAYNDAEMMGRALEGLVSMLDNERVQGPLYQAAA